MYECAPARRYERVYVYNKVFGTQISAKQDESVKILLIDKLFSRNIWWNGKLFVLLHSLLRNTTSQANEERVL